MGRILIILIVILTLLIPNYALPSHNSVINAYVIAKVAKTISENEVKIISEAIDRESDRIGVHRIFFLAILWRESGFKRSSVSQTKDISVAQINFRYWKRKIPHLNAERLVRDSDYAISIMSTVLAICKKEHPNDPLWFGYYNSSKPRLAYKYALKVTENVRKIRTIEKKYQDNKQARVRSKT